jgi:hypothetical protein
MITPFRDRVTGNGLGGCPLDPDPNGKLGGGSHARIVVDKSPSHQARISIRKNGMVWAAGINRERHLVQRRRGLRDSYQISHPVPSRENRFASKGNAVLVFIS